MGIIPAQTLKERGELAELMVACDLRRLYGRLSSTRNPMVLFGSS